MTGSAKQPPRGSMGGEGGVTAIRYRNRNFDTLPEVRRKHAAGRRCMEAVVASQFAWRMGERADLARLALNARHYSVYPCFGAARQRDGVEAVNLVHVIGFLPGRLRKV